MCSNKTQYCLNAFPFNKYVLNVENFCNAPMHVHVCVWYIVTRALLSKYVT